MSQMELSHNKVLSVLSGAPRGAHYLVDESSTKTRATQLILYQVLKPGGNNMV